jgi:hypothetical protein
VVRNCRVILTQQRIFSMEDYCNGNWEEFEEWIRKTIAGDFRWKIRPLDNRASAH